MGTIDRCLGLQECEVSLESQSRAENQWHGGFGGGWKPQLPAAAQATDSILCALRAGHVVVGMSPKLTGRQRRGGCVRVSRLTHQASRSSHQAVGEQHRCSQGRVKFSREKRLLCGLDSAWRRSPTAWGKSESVLPLLSEPVYTRDPGKVEPMASSVHVLHTQAPQGPRRSASFNLLCKALRKI